MFMQDWYDGYKPQESICVPVFMCLCLCVCVVCCAGFLLKCCQKQEGLYRNSLSFSKPKHYEIILIKKGKISNNCKYYKSRKL